MITIAFVARKGGVGRTSLTWNLAGAFAQEGGRILCIDLDGQGSLSRAAFGSEHVESTHPSDTVAAVFSGYDPEPETIIQKTRFENISLVAAGDALEDYATPRPQELGEAQFVIRNFLDCVANQYDLALIDTAPNINVLPAWAALTASEFAISPVPPNAFGTQSISSVLKTMESVQSSVNPAVRMLGYIISMVQRNAVNAGYIKTIRQLHGSQVFKTEIPLAAAFQESIVDLAPITHSKPRSKAAAVTTALASEIQKRILRSLKERKAA